MTPLDTARGLKALKDVTGWSNMEIERRGIMSNQRVSAYLSLLNEPEEIRNLLSPPPAEELTSHITTLHVLEARRVLTSPTEKIAVLQKAADEGLTAAQTRKVAESVDAAPSTRAAWGVYP